MTTRGKIEKLLDQLSEDEIAVEYQRLQRTVEGGRMPAGGAPGGVLRHMTEDEERDGLSWEKFRTQGPRQ
jgi:ParB-like chromosome segregation protein Spo0J